MFIKHDWYTRQRSFVNTLDNFVDLVDFDTVIHTLSLICEEQPKHINKKTQEALFIKPIIHNSKNIFLEPVKLMYVRPHNVDKFKLYFFEIDTLVDYNIVGDLFDLIMTSSKKYSSHIEIKYIYGQSYKSFMKENMEQKLHYKLCDYYLKHILDIHPKIKNTKKLYENPDEYFSKNYNECTLLNEKENTLISYKTPIILGKWIETEYDGTHNIKYFHDIEIKHKNTRSSNFHNVLVKQLGRHDLMEDIYKRFKKWVDIFFDHQEFNNWKDKIRKEAIQIVLGNVFELLDVCLESKTSVEESEYPEGFTKEIIEKCLSV